MIEITPIAQNYFKQLLEQQDEGGAGLRISVVEPGTPRAGCDLQFCPAGEQRSDDMAVEFSAFNLYVDAASSDWLKDAVIDFEENQFHLRLIPRGIWLVLPGFRLILWTDS